jgi:hypothetical protein
VALLKEDEHWWLSETSEDFYWPEGGLGILSNAQLQYLVELLARYEDYGTSADDLLSAFYFYSLQSEIAEDRVRLTVMEGDVDLQDPALFALPVVDEDSRGGFADFLEKLTRAHVQYLNATHEYVEDCTELDMQEELDMLDRDRFFNVTAIHPFDEIDEIITWSPAEWDEA